MGILVTCRQVISVSQIIVNKFNSSSEENDIACKTTTIPKTGFFNYQFILKIFQGLYLLQLVRKKIKMCSTLSVMKLATAVNLSTYTPVCLPATGKDFSGRVS